MIPGPGLGRCDGKHFLSDLLGEAAGTLLPTLPSSPRIGCLIPPYPILSRSQCLLAGEVGGPLKLCAPMQRWPLPHLPMSPLDTLSYLGFLIHRLGFLASGDTQIQTLRAGVPN